jgi:hypothetical protein
MKSAEVIMHQHGCSMETHYYDCTDDCECICGLPMNGNDHSDCPVELRACPEHKAEWERCVAEGMTSEEQIELEQQEEREDEAARLPCECGCAEIDASVIVGWCLHCDHVYAIYTPELQDHHFANHCPEAPTTLKEAARGRLAKRVM